MKSFEELKQLYENQEVDSEEFDEIEFNDNVLKVENNGENLFRIGFAFYTAYDNENNEFDFYY